MTSDTRESKRTKQPREKKVEGHEARPRPGITGEPRRNDNREPRLQRRLVDTTKTVRVTKGGKRLSFRVVVVVGDYRGRVGVGMGHGSSVYDAIRKGEKEARNNVVKVRRTYKGSVPYRLDCKYGRCRVVFRPLGRGSGLISGGAARAVLEMAGMRDVSSKQVGSKSALHNARASLEVLRL